MKVSQITEEEMLRQIREYKENLDQEELKKLDMCLKSAVAYVMSYTGLKEEELDSYEDITIAVLVLVADMWDNRQMYVEKSNVNRVVDTILGMHSINLL